MTMKIGHLLAALGVTLTWLAGCASEDDLAPPPDAEETDAAETEAVPTGESSPSPSSDESDVVSETPVPQCEVPEFEDDSAELPFDELRAQVVDVAGDGIADLLAQVCGTNRCLFGSTDDTGFVLHTGSPGEDLSRAAFKYGDGLEYAQFAYLLPEEPTHELGSQATIALPSVSSADEFEAGATVSSSGATLTLAGNADIQLDLLSFPEDRDHRFVAVEMPERSWPDAVTSHDLGLGMLYVLGPLKTELCPAAALTLPNSPEWDPGAEVEFLLHITDTSNHWGLYGEWAVVATGVVSDDGETIVTDESSGIPQLGALGVRLSDG